MSYTNAIFYIDPENGNDAARTALTTVTVANPSGTITRCTKVGHGLITGAVVTLTLFTSWLNAVWKITRVDDDNFDLIDAVWQATADNNGTVTPFGGMNWADAWKTLTSGATSARLQAGDFVKIKKSPDPVSLGINATWTDDNIAVTLASALTKTICNCESIWTPEANVLAATSNVRQQGSLSAYITFQALFTTGKGAHFDLGSDMNFSAYTGITFWIQATTAVATPNILRIDLCSDAAGDTVVDSFTIASKLPANAYIPLKILKDGGGNLGSSIRSIRIHMLIDTTVNVRLDNFEACNDFSLQSVIRKSTDDPAFSGECWFPIKSILETAIVLGLPV